LDNRQIIKFYFCSELKVKQRSNTDFYQGHDFQNYIGSKFYMKSARKANNSNKPQLHHWIDGMNKIILDMWKPIRLKRIFSN
jgi:hypothetical protein